MAKLVYTGAGDFAANYKQATGKAPPSVMDEESFGRAASQAGIQAPKASASVSALNVPPGFKYTPTQTPAAQALGDKVRQQPSAQTAPLAALGANMHLPPEDMAQLQNDLAARSTSTVGPAGPGAAGPGPVGTQPAAVAAGGNGDLMEFLKSMGLDLGSGAPAFNWDPQAAYRNAQAEAELWMAPQRNELNFTADQRIGDQRLRGEAQLKALKESQAQRRLFGSPVGLSTEQDQIKGNTGAITGIEAERDARLSQLAAQLPLRVQNAMEQARKQAFGEWQGQAQLAQGQRGDFMSFLQNYMQEQGRNSRANMDEQGRNSRFGLEEQGRNTRAAANNEVDWSRLGLDELKADRTYQTDLAKAMGGMQDPETGEWMPTFEAQKWAEQRMDDALRAAGFTRMADGSVVRSTDGQRFDKDVAQLFSQQYGFIFGLDGKPVLDGDGRPVPTLEGAKFDWDKQKFQISEGNKAAYQNTLLALRQSQMISDQQYREAQNEIRKGELSIRNAQLVETNRHNQAMENKPSAAKDPTKAANQAWDGVMSDIANVEDPIKSMNLNPAQRVEAIKAIVVRWAPMLSDADQQALVQLLKSKGYMP